MSEKKNVHFLKWQLTKKKHKYRKTKVSLQISY